MRTYSTLFSTLYDQESPVGNLGRGTHYSVLRFAGVFGNTFQVHDFAVVWDEDHDTRVIPIAEQLHAAGLMWRVLAIGEREGGITVLVRHLEQAEIFVKVARRISETGVDGDSFGCDIEEFPGGGRLIVDDEASRVQNYLRGVDALWQLGTKSIEIAPSR